MMSGWNEICCASLPPESLAVLAAIRELPNVEAALTGGRAIVRWEQGDERVLRTVMPISGAEPFVQRDEQWYRFGHHLPVFDFPDRAAFRPLYQVVTPAPFLATPTATQPLQPVRLTLVHDNQPRPTTAVRCTIAVLAHWADQAPSASLAAIQAVRCETQVLLIGRELPLTGQHFGETACWCRWVAGRSQTFPRLPSGKRLACLMMNCCC